MEEASQTKSTTIWTIIVELNLARMGMGEKRKHALKPRLDFEDKVEEGKAFTDEDRVQSVSNILTA